VDNINTGLDESATRVFVPHTEGTARVAPDPVAAFEPVKNGISEVPELLNGFRVRAVLPHP
jgi:hypothetical protein